MAEEGDLAEASLESARGFYAENLHIVQVESEGDAMRVSFRTTG